MEIKTDARDESGVVLREFIYNDGNPDENLNGSKLVGAIGFCFLGDKLVIVSSGDNKWGTPGGAIEKGESFIEAVNREIKEETNMEVVYHKYIGYQDIINYEKNEKGRQSISFCIVRPIGEFISDPDNDITEIKLIDPVDFKQYIKNWAEAGDYIIKCALDMKKEYYKINEL